MLLRLVIEETGAVGIAVTGKVKSDNSVPVRKLSKNFVKGIERLACAMDENERFTLAGLHIVESCALIARGDASCRALELDRPYLLRLELGCQLIKAFLCGDLARSHLCNLIAQDIFRILGGLCRTVSGIYLAVGYIVPGFDSAEFVIRSIVDRLSCIKHGTLELESIGGLFILLLQALLLPFIGGFACGCRGMKDLLRSAPCGIRFVHFF